MNQDPDPDSKQLGAEREAPLGRWGGGGEGEGSQIQQGRYACSRYYTLQVPLQVNCLDDISFHVSLSPFFLRQLYRLRLRIAYFSSACKGVIMKNIRTLKAQ